MKILVNAKKLTEKKNDLVGYVDITLNDNIVINGIRVCEHDGMTYVDMPAYKTAAGEYKEFCYPVTAEFRSELYGAIKETMNKTEPGALLQEISGEKTESNITTKVHKSEKENVLGFASFCMNDCFAVNNVSIMKSESETFISLPMKKNEQGEWRRVCQATNRTFKTKIENELLTEYKKIITAQEQDLDTSPKSKKK